MASTGTFPKFKPVLMDNSTCKAHRAVIHLLHKFTGKKKRPEGRFFYSENNYLMMAFSSPLA